MESDLRRLLERERSIRREGIEPGLELELTSTLLEKLFVHHVELCRWNPRLSLIGPGTEVEVVQRHYWESLLGICFLGESDTLVVDAGSGGGFPGWVMAAARPDLEVRLLEPKEKKWVFLRTACRKAKLLSCIPLNARVENPLSNELTTQSIDVVTSRALALPTDVLGALFEYHPRLRALLWVGREEIELPKGVSISRFKSLPGSQFRRIIEVKKDS